MSDDDGDRPSDPPETAEDSPPDEFDDEWVSASETIEPEREPAGGADAHSPDTGSESATGTTAASTPAQSAESPPAAGPVTHQHDGGRERPSSLREWLHWFRTVDSGPVMLVREVLSSIMLVLAVGLLLFAISGVWPPMVAVQSGSMNPHMYKGDLVFIVEENRFAPGNKAVEGTGVVPYVDGQERDYSKFGEPGDVIVYKPDNSGTRDPIIHRAHFWVDKGENWYDRADKAHVRANNCQALTNCPAPNSGFITKGDNPGTNKFYDQAQGMSRPVKPAWIKGKAMVRIPALGWIRLKFGALALTERGLAGAFGLAIIGRRVHGGS